MRWLKFIFENYKLILLGILIVVTILSVHPNVIRKGALVVVSGIPKIKSGDIIIKINGIEINSSKDIAKIPNSTVYKIEFLREIFPYIYIKDEVVYPELSIKVIDIPPFNVKFGIDLAGGTKILLAPNESVDDKTLEATKEIIERRLDTFGLKGADVRIISGLARKYIEIEMAGSPEEILEVIEKQGKLEAKIGNNTVFTGRDIVDVCTVTQPGYCVSEVYQKEGYWEGIFSLIISDEAAKRFANLTKDLEEVCTEVECYLEKTLDIYLDGKLMDKLNIVSDLKGKVVKNPAITVRGATKEEVRYRMRVLQTLLMNGELPISVKVVRVDEISPLYGKQVLYNILTVWILAMVAVGIVVFFRYRNMKVSLLMFSIMLIETFSTFGIAALIGWTIDIASLAGIIAAVGTGLDDQIIMTEEVLYGRKREEKVERSLKKAFFIIVASFSVSLVSMMPLLFAGAGILKGFAITNIIGLTIGILITRPAYGDLLKKVVK